MAGLRTANIIGSGPNGLAAAITLAQRGVAVRVFERNPSPGGACSTGDWTLPGFHHDLGSSVYPLGIASPFLQSLPLQRHGLRWLQPEAPLAHPLDPAPGGQPRAVLLEHSLAATAAQFPPHDARNWRLLLASTVRHWPQLVPELLQPLLRLPRHPLLMAIFGAPAMLPAETLARLCFRTEAARALFAGCAAHSVLPLNYLASSAPGLVLAAAGHASGWPIAAGGAQSITNALLAELRALGGELVLDADITDLAALPAADATLLDTSVPTLLRLAADRLTPSYRRALAAFRPGPGIFKVDYALRAPIPWSSPECLRAATVHLGGTLPEISASEADTFHGRHNDRPFVLLVQPSLFDPTRAPAGQHTAWAYCHVPAGSNADRSDAIAAQIERFAPGFRDTILATRTSNAAQLQHWNPNLVGGDVSGGAMTLDQLLFRPTTRQYATSDPQLWLCSSSTPPGGGVHGMCGHLAALAALRRLGAPR